MSESVFFSFFGRGKNLQFSGACGGLSSALYFDDCFCEFFDMSDFFHVGGKFQHFLGRISPLREGGKTLVSDWGAEITKIFDTVLGR